MRLSALFLCAALSAGAHAQDTTATGGAGAEASAQPPAATEPQVNQPQTPKAVPVPDLPVVNKQELEGGLIIEDLKIGDGYEVKPGGAVVAYYHGMLKDGGKVFDSAFDRGEPIAFPLNGVIEGWQKGVPGMKVGGIRRLTIPAALGYAERGAGDAIPPNADLVFIIQLVDALQVEDIKVGEGETAQPRCLAVTAHVVKDTEGNQLEKVPADRPYVWLPGEFEGLQFGIEGMKVGGTRKLTIPKEMNFPPAQPPSTRPSGVPVIVEVELLSVRNLNPGRR